MGTGHIHWLSLSLTHKLSLSLSGTSFGESRGARRAPKLGWTALELRGQTAGRWGFAGAGSCSRPGCRLGMEVPTRTQGADAPCVLAVDRHGSGVPADRDGKRAGGWPGANRRIDGRLGTRRLVFCSQRLLSQGGSESRWWGAQNGIELRPKNNRVIHAASTREQNSRKEKNEFSTAYCDFVVLIKHAVFTSLLFAEKSICIGQQSNIDHCIMDDTTADAWNLD